MKKKILHIQVLPKLSGVQRISLEIIRLLPNNEYDKYILFSNSTDKGDMSECIKQFELAGVKVLLSDNLKREICLSDFSAFVEIYKLCRKEKFDIVHTHSTKSGIVGRIAAYIACVPLVIHTVHGLSFHKFIKSPKWQFYWLCEMFSSLFCDKITLVNNYYGRYFNWFKRKTSTIYNGLDYSGFKIDNDMIIDENSILYVGRLDLQKDPITLLKAAKLVCDINPLAKFTLVGDGEKYEECNNFIEQNNLTRNVFLEGWQSDISKYYQSHSIFAMSSIYESFGLIFLEAGYYKLPVVATNVEGIPEVVKNNITGLLSDPKDYKALANNILKLLNDSNLRVDMGKKGYERVTTMFTIERMVSQYISLYQYK